VLQVINLDHIKLVNNNSIFKTITTVGYVSQTLSLVGENDCYSSFSIYLNKLYILDTRSIHILKLQIWSQRIDDYVNELKFKEAVDQGLEMHNNKNIKALIVYLMMQNNEKIK
jgi:hypothetical protein